VHSCSLSKGKRYCTVLSPGVTLMLSLPHVHSQYKGKAPLLQTAYIWGPTPYCRQTPKSYPLLQGQGLDSTRIRCHFWYHGKSQSTHNSCYVCKSTSLQCRMWGNLNLDARGVWRERGPGA
jgi:hypothetical protein